MRRTWLVAPMCLCMMLGGRVVAGPSGPITWGQTVTIGGGWGRMVQLTNGHWLCVTTRYPSGTNSQLRIHRSTNNGRNWTTVANVAEAGRTLDNGELVALPNGTVLLSMRSLIPNESYRLPVYASTNGGSSWVYRSNIDTSEGTTASQGRGLWEPDFWVLDDGRLVVTYSNEKHPGYSQLISERISTDNGTTWGGESWSVTQPGGGNLRPGMSQMARMADGRYILVYEVVNLGNADVYFKVSDDGVNWPAGLGKRIPCQHCGPFVTSLPNGILLVSSCENQVSFSEDFGGTWQKIDPPAWDLGFVFSWPAIYVTGLNEVGVMVVPGGVKLRFGTVFPRPNWPRLYSETFNTGTDVNWSHYGGNVGLSNGQYLLSNEGTYGTSHVGDGFWRDGVLDADMMLTSEGNAGLMFRATNPDYVGPDDVYGYYAGLDTGGFVVLGRMSYSWTALASSAMNVSLDTWHHVRVRMDGDQIKVYVDDMNTPRISRTDATHRRGQIGVRAFQCDAQFDNVSFSNAVPLMLNLEEQGGQLDFSWPETSVSVKLHGSPTLAGGVALTNQPVLTGDTWNLSAERPVEPAQLYWLQAK